MFGKKETVSRKEFDKLQARYETLEKSFLEFQEGQADINRQMLDAIVANGKRVDALLSAIESLKQ